MRDPFLENLWLDRTKYENEPLHQSNHGHKSDLELNSENEDNGWAIDAYLDMEKNSKFDLNTNQLFKDVQKSVLTYITKIDRLTETKLKGAEPKIREGDDHSRKLAHDSLIDSLNALSRYYKKNNLDNEWRRVVGSHRSEVTQWAKNVVGFINKHSLIEPTK